MAYHDDVNEILKPHYTLQDSENLCFECGETIEGAVVRYDGFADYEFYKSIYFHPKCANLVGQRLIADGFKNRRKQ